MVCKFDKNRSCKLPIPHKSPADMSNIQQKKIFLTVLKKWNLSSIDGVDVKCMHCGTTAAFLLGTLSKIWGVQLSSADLSKRDL